MKRAALILMFFLLLPYNVYAFDITAILNIIGKVYGVNLEMKDLNADSLDQLKNLHDSLTGTHHYGSQDYDSHAYVWDADKWQDVMALAHEQGGSGELGDVISRLADDFPMDDSLNSSNDLENDYYRLEAQTALASRAAAELSYQQAVREEKTIERLHADIDKTEDAKSSADLANRLLAENTLTAVQQTKLLSVIAQQSALEAQEKANRAKETKAFFSIE